MLIAAVLFIPSRARADSIAENVDGPWSTGKKVVIGITGVGFVASTGYMIYSLVSWQNARADLAAFPRTPGDTQTADCTNASQCADLRSASDDAKSAKDHLPVATGLMFGFGLATCVLAAVWPNSNTRIAPTASSTGGALTIGGTF